MTEAKKTATAAKPKAAKAPLKQAEPSKKPQVAKPEAKKAEPKKAVAGATIKVTQTGSKIGRRHDQEATLIGLGLNKRNRTRVLQDTPEVRGMIYKVQHLVKVEK